MFTIPGNDRVTRLSSFIHDDHVIDNEVIDVAASVSIFITRLDVRVCLICLPVEFRARQFLAPPRSHVSPHWTIFATCF
jgi:hypothetical protein